MGDPVIFETKGEIAVITLNRPEKRNAINQDLLTHLYNCLDEVSTNDKIQVAVITGNGKSFCSGLDLSVIETENLFDPRSDGKDLPDIFENCKKPVIGAINGHAITGGFEIALHCDFLIASEKACFADTHIKVGIHPGWGMTQLLQQAVGLRMAKQLSFTCRFIGAEKALQLGLVNEVIPHEELLSRADQIAGEICAVNPEIRSIVKNLMEYKNQATIQESIVNERKGFKKFLKKYASKVLHSDLI